MSGDPPQAIICGIMEHIEEAGVHSGDSSCTIPTNTLSKSVVRQIEENARRLAERLCVRGLMNVQMAVKDDTIYMIEVNPRASRTVPYVAKSRGIPFARIAAKVMMGQSLAEQEIVDRPDAEFFAVKEPIFPFEKFPGVDVVLGPEMRSTGEVMGADRSLPIALAKAKMAVGQALPTEGDVFISVRDSDKPGLIETARQLVSMGFTVHTTRAPTICWPATASQPVRSARSRKGPGPTSGSSGQRGDRSDHQHAHPQGRGYGRRTHSGDGGAQPCSDDHHHDRCQGRRAGDLRLAAGDGRSPPCRTSSRTSHVPRRRPGTWRRRGSRRSSPDLNGQRRLVPGYTGLHASLAHSSRRWP